MKNLRAATALTQDEFRQLVGISRNYVSMIEQGHEPSHVLKRRIEELEEQWANAEEVSGSAREKVQRAMDLQKINFADLHKRTGYAAGVLQAVIEGPGRASERMVEKIASALDLDPADLMEGSDMVVQRGVIGTHGARPDIVPPKGMSVRYVPLISIAQAGTMTDQAFTDGGYDYEGVVAFDIKDPRAFGVRIVGDSMQPRFSEGDCVIVSPSKEAHSGMHVLTRLSDDEGGRVMFKLLHVKEGGKKVIFSSYNPAYPALEFSRDKVLWIYPMAAMVRMMS